MKSVNWALTTALLGLALPAAAQTLAPAPTPRGLTAGDPYHAASGIRPLPTAELELQILQDRWLTLEREQSELDRNLRDTLTRFPDNSPQVTEIRTRREALAKEIAMVKAKIEIANAEREERAAGRGRILLRPVAVQLQNATVRQAADALSKATKISIRVANDVPESTRLTLQARGVTLGAVLEAIGRQTNLKLAPADEGVEIGPWPMVEVNGQQQVFRGRMAPWSSEWGLLPGYASRDGWVFPGEAEATDTPAALPPLADPALAAPGAEPVLPSTQRPAPSPFGGTIEAAPGAAGFGGNRFSRSLPSTALAISVASLGDRMIAVAEPGRGVDNQAGAWITIYRLEGTQLKKVASSFHTLHTTQSASGTQRPTGVPGAGGFLAAPPLPGGVSTPPSEPTVPPAGLPGGVFIPEGAPVAPTAPTAAPVTVRPAPAKKTPPVKK